MASKDNHRSLLESVESFDPEEGKPIHECSVCKSRVRPTFYLHWFSHAVSMLIVLLLILSNGSADIEQPEITLRRNSAYSPALSAVEYHAVRFNGSIDFKSRWKGTPRSELEAAWNSITYDVGSFPITRSDFVEIRKEESTEAAVQFPEHSGYQAMAGLEVFHHLHCLNMLRKVSYSEFYHGHDILWTDPPPVFRDHIDHCIDMLRQYLMCSADVGLTTHVWVKHYQKPYPDFSTWHQCRNFDKIRDWVLGRQMEGDVRNMMKAPDVVELDKPPFP